MPTTHDDLIADWRKRLADASAVSPDASARPAWLIRLRIRLYRFLLSLYESGDWNASKGMELPVADITGDAVTSAAAASVQLDGKPAKSTDVIRQTLSSIATAQDRTRKRGPLTGDSIADGWIVVASSSAHIRTDQLMWLLEQASITARIFNRGNDRFVEVHADDRDRAFAIVAEHLNSLRGSEKHGQFEGINFLVGLVTVTVLYAPVATLYILWPVLRALDGSDLTSTTIRAIAPYFFFGWAACIILYCVYGIWQRARHR